jgi:PAS domain-containing protein
MSLMLVEAHTGTPTLASPPLAPEADGHQARHSELLARLGIHSWSIDLKTEAVRWDRVGPTGAGLVVRATLTDLLRQANDADSATFRAHLKEAIDEGHSGPVRFRFDNLDQGGSEIESVCVLRRVQGHPVVIGLYRSCEREARQAGMVQALRTSLDTLVAECTSCMLVLARNGTILNCNPPFLKFLNVRDRKLAIRQNAVELFGRVSDRMEAIIRGVLMSHDTIGGHAVATFQAGQVRDVRWKAYDLAFQRPEAATRIFAFDLHRVDADDLIG